MCSSVMGIEGLRSMCGVYRACTAIVLQQGAGDSEPVGCLKSGAVALAPNTAAMRGACMGTYVRGGKGSGLATACARA